MSGFRFDSWVLILCLLPCVSAQSGTGLFNPAALLIVFREVLEGCVVVSVMLSALHRIGASHKKKWVWIGAGVGVACSVIIGIAFVAVFWAASQNMLSGRNEAIFSGVVAAFGSLMVTFVAMKMLKFSGMQKKWEAKLQARGATALQGQEQGFSPEELEEMAGSDMSIFLLCFTTVIREGVETALFIGGVGAAADWRGLPLPALVGAVLGLMGGFFIVYSGRTIDNLAYFFYASCIFMLFIAAGLAMTSAYQLESIYAEDALKDGSVVIATPLWDLRACCAETDGFWSVFKGILGWRAAPTFVMGVLYLTYWMFVTAFMWYKYTVGTLFTSKWEAKDLRPSQESINDKHNDTASSIVFSQRGESGSIVDAGANEGEHIPHQEYAVTVDSGDHPNAQVVVGSNLGAVSDAEITLEDIDEPSKAENVPRTSRESFWSKWGMHLWFLAVQVLVWSFLIAISAVVGLRASKGVRLYYIGVQEVEWDYAPTERNGLTSNKFTDPAESDIAMYMLQSEKFNGRKHLKSQFVEFTDKTFTTRKTVDPEWAHKGIVGPIVRAEVGDVIRVVFYNGDPQAAFSLNPRGVFYDKADEGMRYHDGSRRRRRLLYSSDTGSLSIAAGEGPNQLDDKIENANSYIYNWEVPERAGPGPNDPSTVLWTYQSMVNWEFDLFTGLIGALIVTGKGMGDAARKPIDVDREFVVMFLNFNEDESHKTEANLRKYTPKCVDECHFGDEEITESQLKRSINGFMFDNVPGITMTAGERVRWYVFAMGNENDLHAVHFHGHTVLHQGERKQTVELMAGSTAVVDMVPDTPGRFQFEDSVFEHLNAGMVASYLVKAPASPAPAPAAGGVVRQYYIAAEEEDWNYAPTGGSTLMPMDGVTMSAPPVDYFKTSTYKKVRYFEYTDSTFTTRKAVPAEWQHAGILGPTLRAEVGDTIKVAFQNRASQPCSIRPQGLKVDGGEGFSFRGQIVGDKTDAVLPGASHDYSFEVPERAGPGPKDGSSLVWLYYSDVNHVADINAGLVGAIIVTRKGQALADGKPKDVDREFLVLYAIFDENNGWFPVEDSGAEENRKNTINGFIFGNNDKFVMAAQERVRWYLMDVGDVVSLHTVHFHASTVLWNGRRTDVIELLPSSTYTVDTVADSVGEWLLHCHVGAHMASGMITTYKITGPSDSAKQSVVRPVRTYYVAAEEVWWDYAPSGINTVSNLPFEQDFGATYMVRNATRIGRQSRKAQYIEYTDATFTQVAPVAPEWAHKGILGPVLRAQVGDELKVHFLNRCNQPFTMHPHGVEYLKMDEGANYNDGDAFAQKLGSGVAPGETHVYRWYVPERAGPGPADGSSVPWLYHSHVDEIHDVTTGLMGVILVSRADAGPVVNGRVGRPSDIDEERVLLFKVIDEAASWFADTNIQNLTAGPEAIKERCTKDDGEASEDSPYCDSFGESLMRHAINGLMYGNNPALTVQFGKRVRWYLLDLGTEVDMHGVIWNGGTVVLKGARKDHVALMPASMTTADMIPDQKGKWLIKCQVADHFLAGMVGMYEVV